MQEKDYYNIKKVSSTSLSWFEQSPLYFKMRLDKEIDEENAFIYKKGKYVHSFILEPENFDKEYVFLDFEAPKSPQQKDFCSKVARFKSGSKDEILLRAYKECYTTKESDEKVLEKAKALADEYKKYIKSIKVSTIKVVLPTSVKTKLYEIRSKLFEHKVANKLFTVHYNPNIHVYNEYPIEWTHNGVECKSMLDRVIINEENHTITIVDLKTSADYDQFEKKFFDYKYYRQLAFYYGAVQNTFNMPYQGYTINCYVIAINTKEPTEIKVYNISSETLNKGFNEIETLTEQLKWHFDNNQWEYTKDYYEGAGIINI
jgi:hypothetical protein